MSVVCAHCALDGPALVSAILGGDACPGWMVLHRLNGELGPNGSLLDTASSSECCVSAVGGWYEEKEVCCIRSGLDGHDSSIALGDTDAWCGLMKKEHLPLKIGVNAEVVVALLISIMF
jgi:hypothetical protein